MYIPHKKNNALDALILEAHRKNAFIRVQDGRAHSNINARRSSRMYASFDVQVILA